MLSERVVWMECRFLTGLQKFHLYAFKIAPLNNNNPECSERFDGVDLGDGSNRTAHSPRLLRRNATATAVANINFYATASTVESKNVEMTVDCGV